jgi:pimeloyl-ACP methyl ester carboxylesterase
MGLRGGASGKRVRGTPRVPRLRWARWNANLRRVSARRLRGLRDVRDTMGVAPSNIVMFGHSLGTAIAAELAAAHRPRAMVLQSPFSSARDMASRMVVPGITALWGVISRVHFDTIERVRGLACPVWVTHGERDVIIPVRMGCDVFTAAANKGELLIVEGAGHNDVPEVGGTRYWTWLRRAVHETQAVVAVTDAPAGTRSAP